MASEVKIESISDGQYRLLRDAKPYLIKGANWPTPPHFTTLAAAGANSIRTYDDEIEWMLPLAQPYGFSFLAGISIGLERHGFDYTDQPSLDRQFERVRKFVQRYRSRPELLMWAIGNEPDLCAKHPIPLWKEVNRIAQMIHLEDPRHPVITVVAGFDAEKISQLLKYCPDLDALGVNWYGPADSWPKNLRQFGWVKPYIHTEFGPAGYWPKAHGGLGFTKWGAPIEQTSTQKAAFYAENWQNAVVARPDQSLGSYAFIWGPKQERTPTWFSMNLFTGERTELVDAMETGWTGRMPKNPAPAILEWKPERRSGEFFPGETVRIAIRWKCDRPAKLRVETREESTSNQVGGDKEMEPALLPLTLWKESPGGLEVTAPENVGKFRIFVQITTDDQTAATANFPIQVLDLRN